ncbi:helix-turn-helix transcriptional regulator [Macrococcus sp. FSL W8-0367]
MRSNDEIINIISTELSNKGMSAAELSRRVGIAKSALSRYLNKTREFPLNKAEDFANALDISTEYLLGFESNKSEFVETIAAHIDDDVTEEEMEEILAYIEMRRNLRNNRNK